MGAIVTSSEVLKGKAFWTVICDHETFKEITRKLENINIEFEVVYKASLDEVEERDGISYKEYMLLRLAYDMGFFDSPKRIRLEDVARLGNVSKSTASETLRRGIKKSLQDFLSSKNQTTVNNLC